MGHRGDDEDGFADAAGGLHDDPQLAKRMGARGREHVRGSFSIGRLAGDLDRFYRAFLGAGVPRTSLPPVRACP